MFRFFIILWMFLIATPLAYGYGERANSDTPKPDRRNFYQIMGVSESATVGEIRQSYRERAFTLHPDRQASPTFNHTVAELNSIKAEIDRIEKPSEKEQRLKSHIPRLEALASRLQLIVEGMEKTLSSNGAALPSKPTVNDRMERGGVGGGIFLRVNALIEYREKLREWMVKEMVKLNEAKTVLMDSEKRAEYHRQLNEERQTRNRQGRASSHFYTNQSGASTKAGTQTGYGYGHSGTGIGNIRFFEETRLKNLKPPKYSPQALFLFQVFLDQAARVEFLNQNSSLKPSEKQREIQLADRKMTSALRDILRLQEMGWARGMLPGLPDALSRRLDRNPPIIGRRIIDTSDRIISRLYEYIPKEIIEKYAKDPSLFRSSSFSAQQGGGGGQPPLLTQSSAAASTGGSSLSAFRGNVSLGPAPLRSLLYAFEESIKARHLVKGILPYERTAIDLFHQMSFFRQSAQEFIARENRYTELLEKKQQQGKLEGALAQEMKAIEKEMARDRRLFANVLSALGVPTAAQDRIFLQAYMQSLRGDFYQKAMEMSFAGRANERPNSHTGSRAREGFKLSDFETLKYVRETKTFMDHLQQRNYRELFSALSPLNGKKFVSGFIPQFILFYAAIGSVLWTKDNLDEWRYGTQTHPGLTEHVKSNVFSLNGFIGLLAFAVVSNQTGSFLYRMGVKMDGRKLVAGQVSNGRFLRWLAPSGGMLAGFAAYSVFERMRTDEDLQKCAGRIYKNQDLDDSSCDRFWESISSGRWDHLTIDLFLLMGSIYISNSLTQVLGQQIASAMGASKTRQKIAASRLGRIVLFSPWVKALAGICLFFGLNDLLNKYVGTPIKDSLNKRTIKREIVEMSSQNQLFEQIAEDGDPDYPFPIGDSDLIAWRKSVQRMGDLFSQWMETLNGEFALSSTLWRLKLHRITGFYQFGLNFLKSLRSDKNITLLSLERDLLLSEDTKTFMLDTVCPHSDSLPKIKVLYAVIDPSVLSLSEEVDSSKDEFVGDTKISFRKTLTEEDLVIVSDNSSDTSGLETFFKVELESSPLQLWCTEPDNPLVNPFREEHSKLGFMYDIAFLISSKIPLASNGEELDFMPYMNKDLLGLFSSDPAYQALRLPEEEKQVLSKSLLSAGYHLWLSRRLKNSLQENHLPEPLHAAILEGLGLTESALRSFFTGEELLHLKEDFCHSYYPDYVNECIQMEGEDPLGLISWHTEYQWVSAGLYLIKELLNVDEGYTSSPYAELQSNPKAIEVLTLLPPFGSLAYAYFQSDPKALELGLHDLGPLVSAITVQKKGEWHLKNPWVNSARELVSENTQLPLKALICGKESQEDLDPEMAGFFSSESFEIELYDFSKQSFKPLSAFCPAALDEGWLSQLSQILPGESEEEAFKTLLLELPAKVQGQAYENLYMAMEAVSLSYESEEQLEGAYLQNSKEGLDQVSEKTKEALVSLRENYFKGLINMESGFRPSSTEGEETGVHSGSSLVEFQAYYSLLKLGEFDSPFKGLEMSIAQFNYWMGTLKNLLSAGDKSQLIGGETEGSLNQSIGFRNGFDEAAFDRAWKDILQLLESYHQTYKERKESYLSYPDPDLPTLLQVIGYQLGSEALEEALCNASNSLCTGTEGQALIDSLKDEGFSEEKASSFCEGESVHLQAFENFKADVCLREQGCPECHSRFFILREFYRTSHLPIFIDQEVLLSHILQNAIDSWNKKPMIHNIMGSEKRHETDNVYMELIEDVLIELNRSLRSFYQHIEGLNMEQYFEQSIPQ